MLKMTESQPKRKKDWEEIHRILEGHILRQDFQMIYLFPFIHYVLIHYIYKNIQQ